MNSQHILLWYRNDLRLHDHEPLQVALNTGAMVIPIYCFDPRQFGTTSFGFPKTGCFRAQFLLESVATLRVNLRQLGSDLIVRQGRPEQEIPVLCQQMDVTAVYCHAEVTSEEVAVERALDVALTAIAVEFRTFWGHTLYHRDDLPFALEHLPDVFTHYRKAIEKQALVRPPLPTPQRLPAMPSVQMGGQEGELPTLAALGLEPVVPDDRAVMQFQGGETAGLQRVHDYIWEHDRLRTYKDTRNGMIGADYSSKFSPWLALGCLSPRWIYAQVQAYEAQRVQNDSTYWLVFELLWRDYFRFVCDRYGTKVFQSAGIQGIPIPWKQDWLRFDLWREGRMGFPLVDANMRELAATGFMSNRGRQNVASFLTKNLGIDWRMGAEWFESLLIDYDVCSNWGNWNYTAGVGNDARGFRFFNILKQSKDYDPDGNYVKLWLPELSNLPASKVHEPGKLLPVEQTRFKVRVGVDYPHPIVDLFKSAAANETLYKAAVDRAVS